ncbi:MAG: bis(5'-nucleosyl)-tetraphosphatase (symmetrical) YqeK [Treponema sp.]|nr:bis(5'-nucleosyl)-tetraphosphatase (symmetrical) YqeK [Treponema sp.]
MQTDYLALIEKVRDFTEQNVKKSRFEHCVRVAEMTALLCRYYGLDERKGYLAGIGHDMCKNFPVDRQMEIAVRDGEEITEYERRNPSIVHGRAAAVLMEEKFGITDHDIKEAVANHPSAKLGICDLGKCLFLADKIEPERPQSTKEYRENLMRLSLNGMFLSVLIENYEYITVKKGYEIYPHTLEMIDYYKRIVSEENENKA